jgi:hypothetical protein
MWLWPVLMTLANRNGYQRRLEHWLWKASFALGRLRRFKEIFRPEQCCGSEPASCRRIRIGIQHLPSRSAAFDKSGKFFSVADPGYGAFLTPDPGWVKHQEADLL